MLNLNSILTFPIKSLNLMRGVLVAEEDNIKNYYIDNIFNTVWQDGSKHE